MFKYSVNIAWSDEDQGYIATIPELKNLSAFGVTPQEAVKEAKIAAEGHVAILEEDGMSVPAPIKISSYSGQTRLRIPKQLHQQLAAEATKQGVSLNTHMVYLLTGRHEVNKSLLHVENTMNRLIILNALSTSSQNISAYVDPNFFGNIHDESNASFKMEVA